MTGCLTTSDGDEIRLLTAVSMIGSMKVEAYIMQLGRQLGRGRCIRTKA